MSIAHIINKNVWIECNTLENMPRRILGLLLATFTICKIAVKKLYHILKNASITESENPDFTDCFKKSVLIWTPCLFLVLLSPLLIITPKNHQNINSTEVKIQIFLIKIVIITFNVFIKSH